ncbi:MAG: glutathione peroxidase [Arcobacter sp.]|nr:MAG: glutathione peroxidase [Arcobacter sp.]
MNSIYNFKLKTIEGNTLSLQDYKDKTLLIVNVASKCGFTSQYEELETLYKKYKDEGLLILGLPCNQFGFQEAGSNNEISEFCQLNYGVSFPMFSKIKVNGKDEDPLYTFLKKQKTGLLGTKDIKWNFTKFLVNKGGEVIERFAPSTSPLSFEKKIQDIL